MKLAEMRDVVFGYGQTPVLDQLQVQVGTSEFIGLTGPNGSAKTTTLKLLLGLLTPQHGSVELSPTGPKGKPLVLGYVPQNIASFNAGFPSTVYELVRSGLYTRKRWFGLLPSDEVARVEQVLKQVGMWEHRKRKIGELSGGQKQRVCLARSLVLEPDLLVLDEPTTGMDVEARTSFYDLIQHQVQHHGRTVLMVTHDLEETLPRLTRLLVLDKRIRFDGTPQQFQDRMDLRAKTETLPLYCCYDDEEGVE
ncbi:metal ABC transporter ATP-binding protein [Tumebacillus sp. ITR2]|uniref:Metal ABC transporter ATP-binding protein n=1 Tax=Tumebacillus amylolyticus TaxID=2801339 RepID=A0ABS1JBI8_9BACL|nr:metal ABC transporter ATP-binding protein [Tumebacillus amylolyticus]